MTTDPNATPDVTGNQAGQTPCQTAEARQFDFWLGEWEVTWRSGGKGTNTIETVLDGCVILENFDGRPSIELAGMSVSTYNARTGLWHQTWVDNQGGYLDFTGGLEDGKMILTRQAERDGRPIWQRMVWYNLGGQDLDWNWEKSEDGGQTWEILWHIHYQRKKG